MAGGTGFGASFDPDRIAAPRGQQFTKGSDAGFSGSIAGSAWGRAAVLVAGFVALLYVVEVFDSLSGGSFETAGIEPRESDGLSGILLAPVLHGPWDHLISNTVPVLVLGFLALASGIGRGLAATAIIWIIAGIGVWLTGADGTVHIGASALIFGWLTYVISRGWFTRNAVQIVIGLVVLVLYGSLLWGVLPGQPGISWQGHLFGAMGGLLAGWVLSGDERRQRRRTSTGTVRSPQ